MAYEASLGGEEAIAAAHRWLDELGGPRPGSVPIASPDLARQLGLAVDRVGTEAALYDPLLCAGAVLQAQGDLVEAIHLVAAYRSTLPVFGQSGAVDTARMRWLRRVRPAERDPQGGQILGPTADYSLRLPAFGNRSPAQAAVQIGCEPAIGERGASPSGCVVPVSAASDMLERLVRADEGFLLAVAGAAVTRAPMAVGVHELRTGMVEVVLLVPELGAEVSIADIVVSECMTWAVSGQGTSFRHGYGLCLGSSDRRAMATAFLDLDAVDAQGAHEPARLSGDFLASHCDALQTAGYVEHLRMPQYVSFQTLMASQVKGAAGAPQAQRAAGAQ